MPFQAVSLITPDELQTDTLDGNSKICSIPIWPNLRVEIMASITKRGLGRLILKNTTKDTF